MAVADKTWAGPKATVTKLHPPVKGSLREHYQSGHGMAVGAGHAGRAQKPCKLSQEAVASTWQKATGCLSSAPSTADAQCSRGNMLTPRSQLQCALWKEGVSTPVGGAPR